MPVITMTIVAMAVVTMPPTPAIIRMSPTPAPAKADNGNGWRHDHRRSINDRRRGLRINNCGRGSRSVGSIRCWSGRYHGSRLDCRSRRSSRSRGAGGIDSLRRVIINRRRRVIGRLRGNRSANDRSNRQASENTGSYGRARARFSRLHLGADQCQNCGCQNYFFHILPFMVNIQQQHKI